MYYSKAQLVQYNAEKVRGQKEAALLYVRTKLSYHIRPRSCSSKFNRLSLLATLHLSVSVDKRDTMKLYNKLHRNNMKVIARSLCKKIEVIFTGLGFSGTTKMQRYL